MVKTLCLRFILSTIRKFSSHFSVNYVNSPAFIAQRKFFFAVAVLMLAGVSNVSAVTYSWVGPVAGGPWTTGANWQNMSTLATGTVPPTGGGHTILIDPNTTGTCAITNVPTCTHLTLQIGSSYTTGLVTLAGTSNNTITLTGTYPTGGLLVYRPLTISTNCNINTSGAFLNTGKTLTVNPSRVFTITGYFLNQGTVTNSGTLTWNAATCTVEYNGNSGQTVTPANYRNLIFNGTTSRTISGAIGVAGLFTPGTGTSHTVTGSTFTFNGSLAQNVPEFNGTTGYNNLTVSNAAGVAMFTGATNNVVVGGTFTLSSGDFSITGTAGFNNTLTLNGTASITSGTNAIVGSQYSHLVIGGTSALGNLYFDQTTNLATNRLASLTHSKSGGSTLMNTLRLTGTATITAGTFSLGSGGVLDINGTTGVLALGSGATPVVAIGSGGTLQFTTTANTPITRGTTGSITATGGTLAFIPAGTETWTIPADALGSITLTTALTFAMGSGGQLTLNNSSDIILSSGTFSLTSGLTELGAGNLRVAASASFSGTPSVTNMIVTSASSGYYQRSSMSTGVSYIFPIGENVGTAEYGGFAMPFSVGTGMTIGWKVVDATANGANQTDFISRYWQVSSASLPASYTYSINAAPTIAGFAYNGTTGDINGDESKMYTAWSNGGGTWGLADPTAANTTGHFLTLSGRTQAQAPLTNGNYYTGTNVSCLSGPIYTVGSTGDYANITAVITALNGSIICNNLTFKLQSTYTSAGETFPLTFGSLTYDANGPYTITFMPDDNANGNPQPTITSTNPTATIQLSGASRIIFDGRQGGNGSYPKNLTINNTSGSAPAVLFINDAQINNFRYCNIKSTNTGTTSATIVFSTGVTTGNINNVMDYCDIGDAAAVATNMIYSLGSAGEENSATVSNCNIFNFYLASGVAKGIFLSTDNTGWTIENNRFYQTVARTSPANAQIVIQVTDDLSSNPVNTLINNNTIGYSASDGSGTYALGSSSVNAQFVGIQLNSGSGEVDITNNKIQGITFSSNSGSGYSATGAGLFGGMLFASGSMPNNVTGNYIGTHTGVATTSRIIVNAWSSSMSIIYGVRNLSSSTTLNISNNFIGDILIQNATTSVVYGINSSAGVLTADGNYIGSNSATNNSSITLTPQGTWAADNPSGIIGIQVTSGSGLQTITNNTIGNFTNPSTSTNANLNSMPFRAPAIAGIIANSAVQYDIHGNNIRNMTTAGAPNTNQTGVSSLILGIALSSTYSSTTLFQRIYDNTITNLTGSGTGSANGASSYGIYYSGSTNTSSLSNAIYNNHINGISSAGIVLANNNVQTVYGIGIAQGVVNVFNNMIKLGMSSDNASSTTNSIYIVGIEKTSTAQIGKVYYNTVYIRGTGVTSVANVNTFAFRRLGTTSVTDDIRNNILVNERSNTSGTSSKHYAIYFQSITNVPTCDYNIYNASGTGGVLANIGGNGGSATSFAAGTDYATLQALRASTLLQNLNSGIGSITQINFADLNTDLKLNANNCAAGAGIDVTTPFNDGLDKFGNTRAASPAIGAHEFGFNSITSSNNQTYDVYTPVFGSLTIPDQGVCSGTLNYNADISITDFGTGVAGATMFYKLSSNSTWIPIMGSLQSGGTANSGTWRFNLNFAVAASQTYDYFVVAQDGNANIWYNLFDASTSATLSAVSAQAVFSSFNMISGSTSLSGDVYVGSGSVTGSNVYSTFTAASTGLFNAINTNGLSGNLMVYVQGDVTTETGAVALNQWNEYCGTGYTVTIVPTETVGVTPRSVSGTRAAAAGGDGALIRFDGCKNVIVDGNVGGNRMLKFRNTNTNGIQANIYCPVVAFINSANNMSISNCLLETADGSWKAYTVYFGAATTGATGNSYITLDNNMIGSTTNLVANGIWSEGTGATALNHDNNITDNEIINFSYGISNAFPVYGIYVNSGNGSNWNITGNSLYWTMSGTGNPLTFIYFGAGASSTGNAISYNVLGGSDKTGGGSYIGISYLTSGVHTGISLNTAAVTADHNTIKNIRATNTTYGSFEAMYISGSTQATITYNTFGDASSALGLYSDGGFDYTVQTCHLIGINNASSAAVD